MRRWYDGDRRRMQIKQAIREASEAFDKAYHHSPTDDDLIKNTDAVSKDLAEVRRHALANRQATSGAS